MPDRIPTIQKLIGITTMIGQIITPNEETEVSPIIFEKITESAVKYAREKAIAQSKPSEIR